MCFIFSSAFWKLEAAHFFPSAELTVSWQHCPQQPVLLQSGGALLIYRKRCSLHLSQALVAQMSGTLRVPTRHRALVPVGHVLHQ